MPPSYTPARRSSPVERSQMTGTPFGVVNGYNVRPESGTLFSTAARICGGGFTVRPAGAHPNSNIDAISTTLRLAANGGQVGIPWTGTGTYSMLRDSAPDNESIITRLDSRSGCSESYR